MEPGGQTTLGTEPVRSSRARRTWRRLRARTRAVRARVRRTPAGRLGWRIGVGVVGGVMLVAGLLMIPGPGQGWAVVFLALAVLSTEFSWAQRLSHGLWTRLLAFRAWIERRSRGTRVLLGLAAGLVVPLVLLSLAWASLVVTGLPGWLPEVVTDVLTRLPGVD